MARKKGGAKVHMLIDAHQQIGKFKAITAAKVHDKNFLDMIQPRQYRLLVFDKAYNHYLRFAKWTQQNIFLYPQKEKCKIQCPGGFKGK